MSTVTGYNFGANPQLTETIAAAKTLTNKDHGKTFFLTAAAGAAVTLPAPYPGAEFTFVIGSAFATTDWTVITPAAATIINGSVEVAGAVVVGGSEHTITFVASAETIGDNVTLRSNGTVWAVSGAAALSGGITLTAA